LFSSAAKVNTVGHGALFLPSIETLWKQIIFGDTPKKI